MKARNNNIKPVFNNQKTGLPKKIGISISRTYNTISFIEDDKNKDREVSADTAITETYYMMRIIKI